MQIMTLRPLMSYCETYSKVSESLHKQNLKTNPLINSNPHYFTER